MKDWLINSQVWNPEVTDLSEYPLNEFTLVNEEYDDSDGETMARILNRFIGCKGIETVESLELNDNGEGDFGPSGETLVAQKGKLPNLKCLSMGRLCDYQISWIEQIDISPVLDAFPALEYLYIQGSPSMQSPCRHICLEKLVIECGGLSKQVLQQLTESVFPDLVHLELWLGAENYGWNGTAEDTRSFFYHSPFPKLKHLAIKNCEHQTGIAEIAAGSPIIEQLEVLDLSEGTLQDAGAEAILADPNMSKLKSLDLTHHFLSDAMMQRLTQSDIQVEIGDPQQPYSNDHFYTAVGE